MDGVFFCGSGQGYMLSGLHGMGVIFTGWGVSHMPHKKVE
ncbi:hypothetical protein HMPREF9080_00525 [Cardiobacterium valvarum F0432]|uniref:Uncharacterized protein n=1 Tax=Cardiobacterium valvarum F0432 TaxID=797473 RepID=G9ZCP6_9GAMM|nr:hypothetical protein HMPREF9080_00525 [Cardiobacterium valvarum F0432]